MFANKSFIYLNLSFLILFALFTQSSCVMTKKTVYFSDLPDSIKLASLSTAQYAEPRIKIDDILQISIQTLDPQNSAVINQLNSSPAMLTAQTQINGYLVDKEGFVELPMIGKLKLIGLSTYEARELVREKASFYFKNPTVQVRFANFKVTVIGEVSKPSTYILQNEKVSLLDVIGLAGDLTIHGKRENVLLIRDEDGTKKLARLDLNSSDLFKSPYYYLRQNDVIYVEPSKNKVGSVNSVDRQNVSILLTAITVISLALSRF